MTYATLMVSLGLGRPNEAVLEIAGQMAERLGTHVIGIAAAGLSAPLYFAEGEQAQKLLDQGRARTRNEIAALEAQFRGAMQNCASTVEWRSGEELPVRFIVQQACAADIVVIGEDGPDAVSDPLQRATPSDLVMQLGRPLLVVPEAASWLDLRSVLIGWKDTPEARRAIVDALPLLRLARDVTVAEILEDDVNRSAALMRTADVTAWLSRHGIVATAQVPVECGHAAAQLDRIAGETGAGLIVAGAYGHSRLREFILGGVTRRLVNPSGRCSLLAR